MNNKSSKFEYRVMERVGQFFSFYIQMRRYKGPLRFMGWSSCESGLPDVKSPRTFKTKEEAVSFVQEMIRLDDYHLTNGVEVRQVWPDEPDYSNHY